MNAVTEEIKQLKKDDRIPGWAFHWLPVSHNRASHSGSENTRLSIDRR